MMASRLHIHVSSHFSSPGGQRLKGRVWGTQPSYLFEDHDIATVIIFPEGEGCEASHFHHIVSAKGGRTERKEYGEPRGGLGPSSSGFPHRTIHATLATRFLPPSAQDTHRMLLSILFIG